MMKRRLAALPAIYFSAAMALSVSACGGKSESEVASGKFTDPETGEVSNVRVTRADDGSGGSIQIMNKDGDMRLDAGPAGAKMPAGFSLYPGATLDGGLTMAGSDGSGGIANFEVKANGKDVLAFYRKQAEANGMTVTSEFMSGSVHMITAEKESGPVRSVNFQIVPEGELVRAHIVYSMK